MLDPMAGDEMRSTAADPVFFGGGNEGTHHLGMVREPEIIVTAEVDETRARHQPARAFEVALLEVGERFLQRCRVALHAAPGRGATCEQPGPCTCSSCSSAAASVRAA